MVEHRKYYPATVPKAKIGSKGKEDGKFDQPRGVAIDSTGHIYVVDSGNHRVQKFDSNGKFITKWGFKGKGMVNSKILKVLQQTARILFM